LCCTLKRELRGFLGEVHREQELAVGAFLFQSTLEEFDGFDGVHVREHFAEAIDELQFLRIEQQFFLAGARGGDVDGGVGAAFDEAAVEVEFGVAGAFELFEDDFVHFGAGVDEGGADDGEAAAFFDVSCGAEEAFGFLEGVGVNAAGEDFAGVGDFGVVGASEAGDGVEEDDHIALILDEALGFFDDHFRDLHVTAGGFVEGGTDDFRLGGAGHFGHFFGALIDQENHEVAFRMVLGDGVGDFLEEDGFAGARGGDDQHALALADGGDQIDDAHVDFGGAGLEEEALVGVERGEILEVDLLGEEGGFFKVDGLHAEEGEVFFVFLGWTDLAGDDAAGLEAKAANLGGADVDVVGAGEVVVLRRAKEAEAVGEDFEDALADHEAVVLNAFFEDLEDEVLFFETDVIFDAFFFADLVEFLDAHALKIDEVELGAFDLLVFLMGFGIVGVFKVFIRHAGGVDGLADDHFGRGGATDDGVVDLALLLGFRHDCRGFGLGIERGRRSGFDRGGGIAKQFALGVCFFGVVDDFGGGRAGRGLAASGDACHERGSFV
jgi:hypothetical protein